MSSDVHVLGADSGHRRAATPRDRLMRGGGWWTFILMLIVVIAVAESLNAADWSEGLDIVRLAILGGTLFGFILSLTRWEGLFPHFYSLLASIFWVTTLQTHILLGLDLHDGVMELILRNVNWAVALMGGKAAADNLIFVTQLCYLGWWLGYFAAWTLMRHQNALYALIPLGIALLVNLYFSPLKLTGYLLVFLVAALLLGIRVELARNEWRWQLAQIRYAPDIALDFLKAGVGFAALVVILSWTMPNLAERITLERLLRPFEEPWNEVEDTWNRMYQALNYPGVAVAAPAFGKTMTFGGPVALSDRPIFEAQFPERTYWRAAVYDKYTGDGWTNTDDEVAVLDRGEPLGEPRFGATYEITATIRPLETGQKVLVAPPQPVRVSLPADADLTRLPGEEFPVTVSRLKSRVTIKPGSTYQVVSAVTIAPPDLLRADRTTYREWVTARFQQLPDKFPSRIVQLAQEITAPYDNPYDKATAIETYLRQYKYNQEIAAPPEGMDGVEYFLFDVKEGYCDYYASALAVMLRAVGIPARYVAGYTPGEYVQPQEGPGLPDQGLAAQRTGSYHVVERNAHAWVEVFFPTYGWIQFEPTASEPLLARPVPAPSVTPEGTPSIGEGDDFSDLLPDDRFAGGPGPLPRPHTLGRWLGENWPALLAVAAATAVAVVAWLLLRRQRIVLLRDSEAFARLFAAFGKWAARLRVPWPASHTPLEHAARFSDRLPEARLAIERLAMLFVAQRYGRQQPTPEAVAGTVEDWQRLQPLFWKRWLGHALQSRFGKRSSGVPPAQ